MKKLFQYKFLLIVLAVGSLAVTLDSCKKDGDGSPDIKAGNPVADSVSPSTAAGGATLTLKGSGLGQIRKIVFDKDSVPASFYTTLNTENALVFRVPDTISGGPQNIIFTNSEGRTLSVPFTGLAFPSVTSVSNYDFVAGTQLTLTGNNLESVNKVVLNNTTDQATIVSKSKKQLVITMPSTTSPRAALNITNVTGTTLTTQEFVNIDLAYPFFTDSFGPGYENGSWGDAAFISTTEFKTGSKSVGKNYQKGNWHLLGLANWGAGTTQDASYKYLTLWVKGASRDYSLYIMSDKITGGYGNYIEANRIDVPANVWTYFKVPLSTLNLWAGGSTFNQLGFRIKGPDAQDEIFYFDDVLLVK
ncbi:cell shape determination protein CcmA [Niastella caeni]|uniref:Cell shape determination protein CcmA n=1 Tax=Niastella caeni TaxID=2569763 RepID=A0A4S8HXN5_9BACT|nr:IPT/TIG domain-containing protein [Niastella caeni]THU40061.1 cell shape determination protein CcmA [Niastella caeni]